MSMDRFEGKSALITGASGGIGSAVVLRFLQEGCKVLATDINEETLKKLQAEMDEKFPGKCFTMICNVTKKSEAEKAMARGWELFGTLDKLVNVAGGSLPGCPTHLLEVTEERWDMIMDLNAKSTFFFCQEFIRMHKEHGTTGDIVNFASQAGIVPNEYARPHYAAAKGNKHIAAGEAVFAERGYDSLVCFYAFCVLTALEHKCMHAITRRPERLCNGFAVKREHVFVRYYQGLAYGVGRLERFFARYCKRAVLNFNVVLARCVNANALHLPSTSSFSLRPSSSSFVSAAVSPCSRAVLYSLRDAMYASSSLSK